MKKYLAIIGILLIIGAGIWRFAVAPRLEQRFPDGYVWEVNSLGLTSYADEETGQFPEGTTLADDPVNISIRTVTVDASAAPDGQAQITDHYVTRNATTNVVDWEYTTTAVVDQKTGKLVEGDNTGDYFFIPRNPDPKTTYIISNSSYDSLPFTYQDEEDVAGLNTYKYSYRGDMINTQAYTSYMEFEPGQTVYCFDYEMDYWIEPVTGEIVKYREWCEGDWVVDDASGERLYAISRWGSETSGDDLIRSTRKARNLLNTHRMNTLYIPGVLAVLGIILGGVAFLPAGSASNEAQ